eukprot:3521853-Alexandrium_andersonii.AAC.1
MFWVSGGSEPDVAARFEISAERAAAWVGRGLQGARAYRSSLCLRFWRVPRTSGNHQFVYDFMKYGQSMS